MPIEANLRLGGAEVWAFHRAVFGVDLVELAARVALGQEVAPVTAPPLCHAASINFVPARSGTIRALRVPDEVRRAPGLVELVLFKQPGERVLIPPDGFEYLGWMVASGPTPGEARAQLDWLAAACDFDVAPQGER